MPAPPPDPLSAYRAKRALERTPEPAGVVGAPAAPGGLFVVHLHAARRLHYDLRLEMDGVLRSWAVPKGPSADPHDKRLAVLVEDHPLEYGDFEGVIPEGNYGAGAVIVWDRGRWVPVEEPHQGLSHGKLLFDLQGYKLRGRWTLVRIKPRASQRGASPAAGGKDWLLIKERDGFAAQGGAAFDPRSVLSGLSVEELARGEARSQAVLAELQRRHAPRRAVPLARVGLMLAEAQDAPFSKKGWIYEIKYDGYRMLAGRAGGEARLLTRSGRDATGTFPELARAVRALPYEGLVLDGEVVCLDEEGRPSFERLQQRGRLSRPADVRQAALAYPATYFVFDLLAFQGFDLRPLPLIERKRLLRDLLPAAGPLKYADHVEGAGEAFYRAAVQLGLEGVVAKQADAPYRAGRSRAWLKVRAEKSGDFVVVGWTEPKGSRAGFGALHLADYVQGRLTYAGRVGSGFEDQALAAIRESLDQLRREAAPCEGPLPRDRATIWVEPRVVCEVRFKERTEQGLLRQPVFVRFRDDKPPQDCVRNHVTLEAPKDEPAQARDDGGSGSGVPPARGPAGSGGRPATRGTETGAPAPDRVPLSNTDKVFWPEEGYTKGDLIAYYRAISSWLLPYLEDRPLVLTRYPDGIAGKSFFQKDAPGFVPEWIRRERLWSQGAERELDYFICDSEAALVYIANLGAIPLHIWGSRIGTLEQPDWCILDLDPKEAPFRDVVTVARALEALCDAIELPCFVKTSGSTGLHVLVPLGRQLTYEQCRQLAQVLARVIVAELPEIATVTRNPAKREGKVYLDYVQNGHGRLLAAPFSVRPLPGAPVSMPLSWSEVRPGLDLGKFTIRTAPRRMQRLRRDPMRGVLEERPEVLRALERLQRRLAGAGRAR